MRWMSLRRARRRSGTGRRCAGSSRSGNVTLATRADYEYGVMAADGPASVTAGSPVPGEAGDAGGGAGAGGASTAGRAGGAQFEPGMLAHLPTGNNTIELSAVGPNRFFVVGGVPLGEKLIMWWNFAWPVR